jgi:hypothetical protein
MEIISKMIPAIISFQQISSPLASRAVEKSLIVANTCPDKSHEKRQTGAIYMTDNDNTITIAVATEPNTKVFQLGETVAETIARMNLALLPHVANDIPQSINNDDDISTLIDIPHVEVNVVTNNAYLNGWLKKNGYSARLVDDEGILGVLENEDIMTTIVVPAAENLAINPEEGNISLPPDENNILVRVQDEILRSDDNGQRVHDTFITLMLPPEYRMTPSNIDPDTYIRVVAMPTYVHLADQDPEANTDA